MVFTNEQQKTYREENIKNGMCGRCKKNKINSNLNFKINYLRTFVLANTPIIPSLFWRLITIPKNSIIEIYNNKKFEKFREKFPYKICEVCNGR